MNVWRWIGVLFFAAAVTCFVGTQIPAGAGGKDKTDKTGKTDDKTGKTDDKTGKTTTPDKTTPPEKKTETTPPAGGKNEFKAFDGKDAFYQEVYTKTTQKMTVQGQDVTQTQEQTFVIQWTPKGKKDSDYEVEQKVVGVKMKIDIGGNKIEYDSGVEPGKQAKNPMTDFFTALMSQPLTFTISSDLKVKKIDGRTDFIKKLSDTNPAIKTLLDTIMSEDALTKMADPTWFAVPPEKAQQGEKWSKTSELKLGPIGKYETTFNFTLNKTDDKKANIDVSADLKYTAPTEKESTGLPFKIQSATLKSTEPGKGTAVFDRVLGRIESSELTMKLEGDLKIEVGNMSTDIKLTQEQTSKTKTTTNNPLKK